MTDTQALEYFAPDVATQLVVKHPERADRHGNSPLYARIYKRGLKNYLDNGWQVVSVPPAAPKTAKKTVKAPAEAAPPVEAQAVAAGTESEAEAVDKGRKEGRPTKYPRRKKAE